MNLKFKVSITLFLVFVSLFSFGQVSENQVYKLTQVFRNIGNYYVDSIDENELIDKAIIKTLQELDPHSSFFTKDEVEELSRDLEGSFNGIGINYNIIRDTVWILSTIKDGPSEKAGLKSGDRIVYVEGENIAGKGIDDSDLRRLLSGQRGTKVKLSVYRSGNRKLANYTIERDLIKVSSIEAAYMVNDNVGYIKLEKFSGTTVDDFNFALEKLTNEGAEHLILDLRDNGGGYLQAAVKICNHFLDKNSLIVYTEGLKSPKTNYKSKHETKFEINRLIVIIDESSASASEIVSGAVQDWDRGVILGRRSFGKGLVQRPFYLADGSMMRLTIARYYTPSGRCIQKPYGKSKQDYYEEISYRVTHGELMHSDSIKFADSLKYYTLKNNRTIYAGGGIMPDVFVPLDTAMYPNTYRDIASTGKLITFIHDFVDGKRNYFNTVFSDFEKFNNDYNIDQQIINKLIIYTLGSDYADKEGVASSLVNNVNVKNHLKALIANDLWDSQGYYHVINSNSKTFLKAVEIISDKDKYEKVLKN